MTTLVMPLVVSLAAIGVQANTYRPAAEPLPGMVDLRPLSFSLPVGDAQPDPDVADLLADAAYPEAFQLQTGDTGAALDQRSPASGRSVLLAPEPGLLSAADPSAEGDFDLTPGTGLVGIGFRYRFR